MNSGGIGRSRGCSGMYFRFGSGKPCSYFTRKMHGGWETGSNDSGCGCKCEYCTIWDVLLLSKPAGGFSYSGGSWSTDAAALYASGSRNLDTGEARNSDWRSTLSVQRFTIGLYKRHGDNQHKITGADKSVSIKERKAGKEKQNGRIFITGSIRGGV